ncbi:MAG TPA: YadA-like family protein, partial [Rhodanobacteraceae bacterium]|nr:YadA-like family protein [Rhodanobacteraceae bacterium]
RRITNVAAGGAPTDAVNVSQLQSLADTVAADQTHYYSVNDGGTPGGNYDNDGATGVDSLAAGVGASATAGNATAVGQGATAYATNASAIGAGSFAVGANGTAVGDASQARGQNSTALGYSAYASGADSTAIGSAVVRGDSSVGMGNGAYGGGTAAVAIGKGAATGNNARPTNGNYAVAIGNGAYAGSAAGSDVALGNGAMGFGGYSTAIGARSVATGSHASAFGFGALALGNDSVALGEGAIAANQNDVALGTASVTDAPNPTGSVVIGGTTYTFAGGNPQSVVSVGSAGNERQITNVAAGQLNATSTDAVNGSQLYATNQAVDAVSSVANEGWNVTTAATGTGVANGTSVANVGPGQTMTLTAGDNIIATQNGTDVAIGLNPVLTGLTSVTAGNTTMDTNGLTISGGPNGTVSLTGDGLDNGGNQIHGVADGTAPTDAVNVSQLDTAVAGVKTHYYSVNDGGTQQANYDDDGATGVNSIAAGVAASASGDLGTAVGAGSNASAFGTTALGSYAQAAGSYATAVGLAAYAVVGATALGYFSGADAYGTAVGQHANAYAGATAIGADAYASGYGSFAGGQNAYAGGYAATALGYRAAALGDGSVALGTNAVASGDYATAVGPFALAQGYSSAALGDSANAVGDRSLALGANAVANNADDVALGDGSVTSAANPTPNGVINGLTYNYAGGNPGSVVSVGSPGNERQITNVAAGRVSATSTDAVNGSQLYATNQAIGGIQQQINNINQGGSGQFQTSADSTGSPSPTGTNSAAGGANATASGTDSLAVGNDSTASGDQSTAIGTSSTASGTGSTAIGDGAQATGDNSVALGAGSVANGDNEVSVGSAGNERKITNVAAGTAPTDAVNVSQLKQAQAGGVQYDTNNDGSTDYSSITLNPGGDSPTVIHNVGAGTASTDAVNVGQMNTAIAGAVTSANNYTDQRYNELKGSLNQIGDRANAGIASAIAAASLPQPYAPNQSSLGVGMGSFHGEAGIAVGLSKISESGRFILKANVSSDTRGDVGAGIGAGIVW